MHILFAFSIIAAMPLIVMWVAYRVFLSQKRMPGFSRYFFIIGMMATALSFAIGRFIPISLPESASAITAISSFANEAASGQKLIEETIEETMPIEAAALDEAWTPSTRLWDMLLLIYSVGVAAMLLGFVGSMARIAHIVLKSRRVCKGGRTFYITDRSDVSPFSIGGIIVLNRKDYGRGLDMILAHETGHAMHMHTIDMLMAQLMITACWYNPAAWLIRRDLIINHEYQADAYALGLGFDKFEYQKLLLEISSIGHQPSLANNFNYLNIKKRFIMMNSTKPIKMRILAGLLPALMLAGAILFSCSNSKVQEAAETTMAAANADTDSNVFLIRGANVDAEAVTDGNFIYVGDLATTDKPDSSFDGIVYPITGCIATAKKSTIDELAPAGAEYIIDNKKATAEQYQALAEEDIQIVTLDGDKVEIYTRLDANEPNADVTANGNEEARRLHTLFANLSEAWPSLSSVVVDGKEYPIDGADIEKFNAEHPGLINAVHGISVSGDKAQITTWGKK